MTEQGDDDDKSYRRRLRSLLLYLCYVFRALINSLCVDSAIRLSQDM